MADAPDTVSTLAGFLKPVFGELQQLLTETSILQKAFPFAKGDLVGDHFEEPMLVKAPWSVSYCGSAGGSTTLEDAKASVTAQAKITPYLMVLRDQISYSLLDRSAEGGKQAFMAAGTFVAKNLAMMARNLQEVSMLCGQQGIGTVSGAVAGQVITITDASFRPGILSMLEGASVVVMQSDLSTPRQSTLSVGAVDLDAKTITLVGTVTGITTNDVVFIKSANVSGTLNEQLGLRKQIGAQTGTVFNIDKALYSIYRGNVLASVGAAGPGTLLNAATKAINRGFQGEMLAVVSPRFWNVLNSQLASQRVFDSSYKSSMAETGTNEITVTGQGVSIKVVSHPYQAEGEFMLLPAIWVKRIGSVDLSFEIPGTTSKYFQPIPGVTAVETQCRSDQQVYLQRPAWAVQASGVTYA